jgi:hypothetical protein
MDANLICFNCKNLNEDGFGCKAFPDGITVEITDEGLPHDKPLTDQNNDFVFDPIKEIKNG